MLERERKKERDRERERDGERERIEWERKLRDSICTTGLSVMMTK